MVAINQAYAPSETDLQPQNRVGSFFERTQSRAWRSQPLSRTATKEKTITLTITVSGRPFWLSRDPLWMAESLPEGPNLYAYVGNDPINYYDPYGRNAACALGGLWAGAAAEPTPVGEVIATSATVGYGAY